MYKNWKPSTKGNITFKEAFSQFVNEKKAYGLSQSSMRSYEQTLYLYTTSCDIDTDDMMSITKDDITNWVTIMRNKGNKDASINHYLMSMRTFINWSIKNEYIEPFKVSLVRVVDEGVKFFTSEELEKLIKKPSKKDSFVEWRTYTMICFIMATGARASTITNIKISDINFDRKEVVYRHLKNKKIATIPVSSTLESTIKEYLNMWRRNTDNEWLFCNVDESQMTVTTVSRCIEKYCVKRDVNPRGAHSLRHTFAREWVLNNGNAFALQKLLTHSTMDMTKRYVNLFGEDLKKDFDTFSPLDNIKNSGMCRTVTRNK